MITVTDTDRIRFARASVLLSDAITRLAQSTIAATGVVPFPTADAPNDWEKLQEVGANLQLGYLPVWNGASESTIYTDADTNILFRYWHDMGHLDHDCSFTPEDEKRLQVDHHLPAVQSVLGDMVESDRRNVGVLQLALAMYYADTVGQIEYTVRHHEFPTDQVEFVMAYVTDPAAAVDSIY